MGGGSCVVGVTSSRFSGGGRESGSDGRESASGGREGASGGREGASGLRARRRSAAASSSMLIGRVGPSPGCVSSGKGGGDEGIRGGSTGIGGRPSNGLFAAPASSLERTIICARGSAPVGGPIGAGPICVRSGSVTEPTGGSSSTEARASARLFASEAGSGGGGGGPCAGRPCAPAPAPAIGVLDARRRLARRLVQLGRRLAHRLLLLQLVAEGAAHELGDVVARESALLLRVEEEALQVGGISLHTGSDRRRPSRAPSG